MRPSSPNEIAAMGGFPEIVKPYKSVIFHHYEIGACIDGFINTIHLILPEHPGKRASYVSISSGASTHDRFEDADGIRDALPFF